MAQLNQSPILLNLRRKILLNQPHLKTVSNSNIHTFRARVASKVQQLTVDFIPKQNGSGRATPTNIRTINGYNSINVTRCGGNIFDYSNLTGGLINDVTWTVNNDGTIIANGTTNSSTSSIIATALNLPSGNYLTYGCNNLIQHKKDMFIWDSIINARAKKWDQITDMQILSNQWNEVYINNSHRQTFNFRVDKDATANNMIYTAAISVPNFQDTSLYYGNTYSIEIPSSIGTAYGGTLNMLTGELVLTYGKKVVDQNNNITSVTRSGDKIRGWCALTNPALDVKNYPPICDMFTYTDKDYAGHYKPENGQIGDFGNSSSYANSAWFWLPYGGTDGVQAASVAGVKAYFQSHPATFIGRLVTPITYQLTPIELKTFRSINNIFSTQASNITLKYYE